MDLNQLLLESLQLLGLGMGAVFIILSLLIALITLVSKLLPGDAPPPAVAEPPRPGIDRDHAAAIAAAIHRYRKTR